MNKLLPHFLRLCGLGLLLVGLVAAYYGPLEIYVFYLFSEGGRFHYAGFGMGSVWFAALVVQNLGYYVIAAVCIPLGIGHLKLRRWALTLTHLYLWFWLGAGLLLIGNALTLLPPVLWPGPEPRVSWAGMATPAVAALVLLVVLPAGALVFYRSERVRSVFTRHDARRYWTESYPFPLLVVLLLFVAMVVVLHIAVFFQSMFPFFGQILLGRQPVYLVALCILLLGILMYGLVRLQTWAWWGSVAYVSGLAVSTAWSFAGYRVRDLVLLLRPPAYELDFLNQLTLLQEFQPVGLLTVPLLAALALLVCSRRHFGQGSDHPRLAGS